MQFRQGHAWQIVLHKALDHLIRETKRSDADVKAAARLECSRSTLYRFRMSPVADERQAHRRFRLSDHDAGRLWDYLWREGAVEAVLDGDDSGALRASLFSERDLAEVLMATFRARGERVDELARRGITGQYFCYKDSVRLPGAIVKSLMSISLTEGGYLSLSDDQHSSGRGIIGHAVSHERSTGIAFVKSDRIWAVLAEKDRDQPRMLCLTLYEAGRIADGEERIISLRGHLIEGSLKYSNQGSYSPVVLVAVAAEQAAWRRAYGEELVVDAHLDLVLPNDASSERPLVAPMIREVLAAMRSGK